MSNSYTPITGNPRRKTKRSSRSDDTGTSSASRSDAARDRTRRVSVTPQDPDALEALAEEFGLPQSKVYNMAFRALLEKLGRG